MTLANIFAEAAAARSAAPLAPSIQTEDDWSPLDLLNPEKSAFGAGLEWLGHPGQAIMNVVGGDYGAAGRHVLDFLGKIPDAVLPGDWIPDATTADDFTSGSELLNLADDTPFIGKLAADIGLGVALDPLSYLTFGGTSAATNIARAANQAQNLRRAAGAARTAGQTFADDGARLAAQIAEQGMAGGMTRGDWRSVLESSLSRQGRKAVQAGIEAGDDPLEALLHAAKPKGGTAADAAAMVDPDALAAATRGNPMFNQGGISLSDPLGFLQGPQLLREGAIMDRLPAPAKVAVQAVKDAVSGPMTKAKAYLGWLNGGKMGGGLLSKAGATGGATARAGQRHLEEVFRGITPLEDEAVAMAFDNLVREADGSVTRLIDPTESTTAAQRVEMLRKHMTGTDEITGMTADGMKTRRASDFQNNVDWDRVSTVVNKLDEFNQAQWTELIERGHIKAPTVWAAADGTVVPVDELAARYAGELKDSTGLKKQWTKTADKLSRKLRDIRMRIRERGIGGAEPDARTAALAERESEVAKLLDAEQEAIGHLDDHLAANADFQTWLANEGFTAQPHMEGAKDYLQRTFTGRKADTVDIGDAGPQALQARKLLTANQLMSFLKANKDIKLERSAMKRALGRASQQGRMVQRSELIKGLLGTDRYLNDHNLRTQVEAFLKTAEVTDPEFAKLATTVLQGSGPRSGPMKLLAKTNRIFKPAAVYGLFMPRISGIVRNAMGGIPMAGAAGGIEAAGRVARQTPMNIADAMVQGFNKVFGTKLDVDQVAREIRQVDEAFRQAGGSSEAAVRALRGADSRTAAEAVEFGVFDDFIRNEDLLSDAGLTGAGRWLRKAMGEKGATKTFDFMDMPAEMFQAVESRMRYQHFKALRQQGMSPRRAAEEVREAYYDYSIMTPENRTLRDLVPFAAFTTNAIRQTSRAIAKRPSYGVALGQLYGNPDEPVRPWIGNQPSVRVGTDEEGNSIYATSLGLPAEAMNIIPSGGLRDIGRDLRTGVVSSAHPLLKAAYGYTTGQDPFFGTTYGSYDKTPYALQALGAGESSEAARLYNEAASTGLLQPIASPLQQLSRAMDPRMSGGQKALNLLTGARLAVNDPNRATIEIIEDELRNDPNAKMRVSYSGGSDAMNELMRAARKKAEDKRKAQAVQ